MSQLLFGSARSSSSFELGVAALQAEQPEQAIALFEQSIKQNENFIPAYLNLARALCDVNLLEEAEGTLKKALELEPDHPDVRGNLGTVQALLGRKDEAVQNLERALESQPLNVAYHRSLAVFKKYRESEDPHIHAMEAALRDPALQPESKAGLYFALGKAYEDFADYRTSFEYYETGNAFVKGTLNFSLTIPAGYFQKIREHFTREFFDAHKEAGLKDKTPIFILGMPRSGTSLVEQILASHTEVHGAGELRDVFRLFPQDAEADFASLTEDKIMQCAQDYLAVLKQKKAQTKFVTDKMPLNFRYVGFIKAMFPQAKIIHCVRDPRDVCLSIFKQLFVAPLPFAYDQRDLAGYYGLYRDMMAHWHRVFPGDILDFQYEDLIEDQKKGTQKLLDYCGLPWQDSCLEFHKTQRGVTTASAAQVKKPLYKSARGHWRNYEEFLAPEIIKL